MELHMQRQTTVAGCSNAKSIFLQGPSKPNRVSFAENNNQAYINPKT
jgi:hypothetical protein